MKKQKPLYGFYSQAVNWEGNTAKTGRAIVWNPGYWQRDITLLPAAAQANRFNSGAVIRPA